ncbi:Vegetative incompatibility protein HET-E-1 [Rhizoctonia solani AG-1 IB]|uniref:Vegetative incompatibility protein HET-E-1 n=1 Tax=Thanatephorus cucumeris (strain AG1-IB / isolate 7/3/14) TaxID=1108050 RepID=M5CHC3_THACB|nr:Vegetative incompatibility protein HET-E-1 [Rhizoctonia solani AG-1 IB]
MRPNRVRAHLKSWSDGLLNSFSSSSRRTKQGDWRALDIALATLETAFEVFPPIKAALNGLREVIRHTEISKQNLHEYKQIASELQAHTDSLQACVDKAKPTWMAHSIAKIARALEEENERIKAQQDRGGMSRTISALRDEDTILQSYRRIKSLFRQLQIDISLSTWSSVREQHMTSALDKLLPVSGAWYDAALSVEAHRGGCTPGTRERIIQDFLDWASDKDTYKLYWMNGMAGTGKTTIAYTLCRRLEKTKQLGACFFCSRISPDCRDVNRVFTTIAHQLSQYSNPYRNKLFEVLTDTPNIAQRNIAVQFDSLIMKPLLAIGDALPADIVIVVDALDECSSGGEQVLALLVENAARLPVRFIVTSRPEPAIARQMEVLQASSAHRIFHLHDIEESFVQEDIAAYLRHAFQRSTIVTTPHDIERLAAYAGSLFIVAATTVRYILGHGTGAGTEKQYTTIDSLYKAILERVMEQLEDNETLGICRVLWATLCVREPVSISTLSKILKFNICSIETSRRLDKDIPDLKGRLEECVSSELFYACRYWADHLQIASVSDETTSLLRRFLYEHLLFWIEVINLRGWISSAGDTMLQALKWLTDSAPANVSSSSDLAKLERAIRDAQAFVTSFAASPVSHSTPHLYLSSLPTSSKHSELFAHHRNRFRGLPGELASTRQEAKSGIGALAVWTPGYNVTSLAVSPDGARLASGSHGGAIRIWDARLGAVILDLIGGHPTSTSIGTIAFSSSGASLASGAYDGSICIWNVATAGVLIQTIKQHTLSINTVAFHPNSHILASASDDGSVCLWDLHDRQKPSLRFQFDDDSHWDVSFSPDGSQFASAGPSQGMRGLSNGRGTRQVGRASHPAQMTRRFGSGAHTMALCLPDPFTST